MRDTFIPLHRKYFTEEQSNAILESHIFLKEKRDDTLKVRRVVGVNKHRDFISKEDASSPTFTTNSVLLTYIADVEEHLDVATVEIPNSFIQNGIEYENYMAIIKI